MGIFNGDALPDDLNFGVEDFNRKVIADSFNKKLGKQIGQYENAGYAGMMVFGRDEQVKLFD